MAIDVATIQLTDAERRLLAEASARTGKPWEELLRNALDQIEETAGPSPANGEKLESLFDRLSKHGLIGCLDGGPENLSTNPVRMEGFGIAPRGDVRSARP